MSNWRSVFGFDGEDLDFETVHMRYRELTLQRDPLLTVERLQQLNWALEQARKELATGRSPP